MPDELAAVACAGVKVALQTRGERRITTDDGLDDADQVGYPRRLQRCAAEEAQHGKVFEQPLGKQQGGKQPPKPS